jgi:hypothetical protein
LAAVWIGAAIAAGHGLYGIVYRTLNVAGVVDVDGAAFDAARHGWVLWDLFLFEPWFLIEGVLFGALTGGDGGCRGPATLDHRRGCRRDGGHHDRDAGAAGGLRYSVRRR